LSVMTSFAVGVMMSCTNAPRLCWVPPDTRWTDSAACCVTPTIDVGTAATNASSWLSPSTHRQSDDVACRRRVGHGEEVEVRLLSVDEHARLEIALVSQSGPDAAVHRRPPGVVELSDLAVDAALGE